MRVLKRILVTGSSGVIGRPLRIALHRAGYSTVGLDLRGEGADGGDLRNRADIAERLGAGVVGIVHLAAVSRVLEGQRDALGCWATNVEGTRLLLDVAEQTVTPPWLVFASSREVYGQPVILPVEEDFELRPVNIYGRSKATAEILCERSSLHTAILRFSNVYGSTDDYPDRLIPAFARQAVEGEQLRIDGRNHTFDFTHLSDTIDGIVAVVQRLNQGLAVPPLHLVTGRSTSIGDLAAMAIDIARSSSTTREAPPRTYDVSAFRGDPSRASRVLGWKAQVDLRRGLTQLIQDVQAAS